MSAPICHVVAAGPRARLDIDLGKNDLLIAADGGYSHCIAAGLEPQLFIGDLDSLPKELGEGIACERMTLPVDKDDTDTLAACNVGLARGYVEFKIHAALGGDVGHEIANLQLLAYLHDRGAHGILYGASQEVHLVVPDASLQSFCAEPGTRVSVSAFGGRARGVILRGLHWELEDAEMVPNRPTGVSNRVEDGEFEIGVLSGALLVVIG